MVFIDAIHVKIRDGQVANRPIRLAMAAHACLTVLRARQLGAGKAETDSLPLIHLSLAELRRLITRLDHRRKTIEHRRS